MLHLGGARTALFNWLYAKAKGGKFLLRVEDTDRARSSKEAEAEIKQSLEWLGLNWDDAIILQSTRLERHRQVAQELLQAGKAYYCYTSPEELAEKRAKAIKEGRSPRYDGAWRDCDDTPPDGVKPVLRLRAPQNGTLQIHDLVQGELEVAYSELDDFILLRADATPTYMLSVVVDDYDMGISHVIRGDDHLTNAFRQHMLFTAAGFPAPIFAHIPLLHGADGKKLSKRHGALAVSEWREQGFLAEAMLNFLLRLGWGKGESEFINMQQAIEIFDIGELGKAPSQLDFTKLRHYNNHYLRELANNDSDKLLALLKLPLDKTDMQISEKAALTKLLPALAERSSTLLEIIEGADFIFNPPNLPLSDPKAVQALEDGKEFIALLYASLQEQEIWQNTEIMASLKNLAANKDIKAGQLLRPLRACIVGKMDSPDLGNILEALGKAEIVTRIKKIIP